MSAGTQREHDAERSIEPRHVVRNGRGAGRDRRPVGIAREIREPAEGVADAPEAGARAVRAGLAEADMRTITSLWFCLLSTSQPRPHFSSVPGWKFSTKTSACETNRFRISAPSGFLKSSVADYLVAAFLQPGQRVASLRDGAELAQRIAHLRQLDLDDFGAELRQLRRAERAGEKARYIDDANALHRLDGRVRRGCVGHGRVSIAPAAICCCRRCAGPSLVRVAHDRRSGSR